MPHSFYVQTCFKCIFQKMTYVFSFKACFKFFHDQCLSHFSVYFKVLISYPFCLYFSYDVDSSAYYQDHSQEDHSIQAMMSSLILTTQVSYSFSISFSYSYVLIKNSWGYVPATYNRYQQRLHRYPVRVILCIFSFPYFKLRHCKILIEIY